MAASPHRHSPGQQVRQAELLSAASGWVTAPPGERSPAPVSAVARTVLEAHRDSDGGCAAGCGTWPCDSVINAATSG